MKWLVKVIETWLAAREDAERGELTYRQHRDASDPFWIEHGWWLTPADWSLGVSIGWEHCSPLWEGRYSLVVEVGPFTWHVSIVQPREES